MRTGLKWTSALLLAAALLATAAVYWPGLRGGFVFDDFPNIVDNAGVHITHASSADLARAALASPSSEFHRPLASLSFGLNYLATGINPWPMKFTNLLIHLLNGVLLYCMLRELLRAWTLRIEGRLQANSYSSDNDRARNGINEVAARRLALAVTAAWLLLPINLMAVLYVVQRMESLCQVFVLAGLWMYLAGRRRMLAEPGHRGFALATTGLVLGTAIGVLAKESAVLLPVYAFLIEFTLLGFRSARESFSCRAEPLSPRESGRADGSAVADRVMETEPSPGAARHPLPEGEGRAYDRRLIVLYVCVLLLPAVLGLAWMFPQVFAPDAWVDRPFTLAQRLLTEPRVLVDYLRWIVFPDPRVLSVYHDEIGISTGLFSPPTTLAAIVMLAALLGMALWLRRRLPLLALGILWFFAAQLLTATVFPLELVYEHRNYFASIGVLLALFSLLLGMRKAIAMPIVRGAIVVLLLILSAGVTFMRAQEWSNPLRLALSEANRHPRSARADYEAGRLLLIESNYDPGARSFAPSKMYLQRAVGIPASSILPEQALIMLEDRSGQPVDPRLWTSMIDKLRTQPISEEDISGLISLTDCRARPHTCDFDIASLQQAYLAALAHPAPFARLLAAYANFARDLLHDDALAIRYLREVVVQAPSETAYRIELTHLLAIHGMTGEAVRDLNALRRMNTLGRLDAQIATLEQQAERGGPPLAR